jgi:hypothetical protein
MLLFAPSALQACIKRTQRGRRAPSATKVGDLFERIKCQDPAEAILRAPKPVVPQASSTTSRERRSAAPALLHTISRAWAKQDAPPSTVSLGSFINNR